METPTHTPHIVYEDTDMVVINKPSGMITHPKNKEDTSYAVTTWAVEHYPSIAHVGEDPSRPGIMHRLDRDTSGLLIIAKTNSAFFYFKKLFQEKTIRKSYLALVHGTPPKTHDIIDLPMGRIGIKRTTRSKDGKLKDKKEAITEYRVVKSYPHFSLLEVSPKTGRTHQIRVHLNAIGHPVCGDPVYGSRRRDNPPHLSRLFLHAFRLSFTAPNGQNLSLECDLPLELASVVDTLDKNDVVG